MGITERVVLPSRDETEQLLWGASPPSPKSERLIVREVAEKITDELDLENPLFEKFSTLSAVALNMGERLDSHPIDEKAMEFYVCEKSGVLQGMMDIKIQDRALQILLLCSAPRNIDSSLVEKVTGEPQPRPVKGVGNTLLMRVFSRAAESQCSKVTVITYDDAKGFYARYGFAKISSDPFVTKMVYLRSGAASAAP